MRYTPTPPIGVCRRIWFTFRSAPAEVNAPAHEAHTTTASAPPLCLCHTERRRTPTRGTARVRPALHKCARAIVRGAVQTSWGTGAPEEKSPCLQKFSRICRHLRRRSPSPRGGLPPLPLPHPILDGREQAGDRFCPSTARQRHRGHHPSQVPPWPFHRWTGQRTAAASGLGLRPVTARPWSISLTPAHRG
jgi:hypothetical protein